MMASYGGPPRTQRFRAAAPSLCEDSHGSTNQSRRWLDDFLVAAYIIVAVVERLAPIIFWVFFLHNLYVW